MWPEFDWMTGRDFLQTCWLGKLDWLVYNQNNVTQSYATKSLV